MAVALITIRKKQALEEKEARDALEEKDSSQRDARHESSVQARVERDDSSAHAPETGRAAAVGAFNLDEDEDGFISMGEMKRMNGVHFHKDKNGKLRAILPVDALREIHTKTK